MKFVVYLTLGLLAFVGLPNAASAQPAPSQLGKVLEIRGPLGAVIVLRGAQTYALQVGDILFEDDRVVTRSNGRVKLVANGCERSLDPASSILIEADICKVPPVTLTSLPSAAGLLAVETTAP